MKITEISKPGHERILHIEDNASGLRGFIAIHSTIRGPSAGGCRLWHYRDEEDALVDAMRLSEGMSYKNAMAGLPMGGGKAVIMGPVPDNRREAQFRALGRAIHACGGKYISAEDVGVTVADMAIAARETPYVTGVGGNEGAAGGNPGPYTARGVLRALESAARFEMGCERLAGLRVAIQGIGSVGGHLCALLTERQVSLVVADKDLARARWANELYDARIMGIDEILTTDADIIVPCALGGVITRDVARNIKGRILAGGANNQLENGLAGDTLFERGITYAPDFVCNAGGIIAVTGEYLGQDDPTFIAENIDAIGPRVASILERARDRAMPPHRLAIELAKGLLRPVSEDIFRAGGTIEDISTIPVATG